MLKENNFLAYLLRIVEEVVFINLLDSGTLVFLISNTIDVNKVEQILRRHYFRAVIKEYTERSRS